jgi:hypothetical protein
LYHIEHLHDSKVFDLSVAAPAAAGAATQAAPSTTGCKQQQQVHSYFGEQEGINSRMLKQLGIHSRVSTQGSNNRAQEQQGIACTVQSCRGASLLKHGLPRGQVKAVPGAGGDEQIAR